MSHTINEVTRHVPLSKPYVPASFKAKRNWRPLLPALPKTLAALAVFVLLAYVGDATKFVMIGEGRSAMSLISAAGVLVALYGIGITLKAIENVVITRNENTTANRHWYGTDVVLPLMRKYTPAAVESSFPLWKNLVEQGETGMWSRIDGTNDGNVYQYKLLEPNAAGKSFLVITTAVQIAEPEDEYVGMKL